MYTFKDVAENISKKVGLPLEKIREMGPEEMRDHLEKKNKKKFKITSSYPAIGRGNVLRDNLTTSEEINKDIDAILKIKKKGKYRVNSRVL